MSAATMPAFQLLAVAFAVAWLVLSRFERDAGSGRTARQRPRSRTVSVLACALGLCGCDVFFIFATAWIPPAQAHLISYLWPLMVGSVGGIVGLFRLGGRHFAALGLGCGGVAFVIEPTTLAVSWIGISLAFLSGLSWAVYCLLRLWRGSEAPDVLGRACGVSALMRAALHLLLEKPTLPTLMPLLAVIWAGIGPLALANLAWDCGIRRGDGRMLATMAYGTPLAATVLLILLGLAEPTFGLCVGALMIVGAGWLSQGESGRSGGGT